MYKFPCLVQYNPVAQMSKDIHNTTANWQQINTQHTHDTHDKSVGIVSN